MRYKGVEYTVRRTESADVWKWQFNLGETVKTGTTTTRLELLAERRVQLKIDNALRQNKPD